MQSTRTGIHGYTRCPDGLILALINAEDPPEEKEILVIEGPDQEQAQKVGDGTAGYENDELNPYREGDEEAPQENEDKGHDEPCKEGA
jgi:hypothetical protein